jgi:hypothetical protein
MATAKKNAKELAKELMSALEGDNGDVNVVAARRDYWRQRTLEARNLIRKIVPQMESAVKTLNALQADISKERKHWIGPKDPQKNPPKGFYRGED